MSRHFLVFGSHPRLSLAEAKAVLGGHRPRLIGTVAIFETDAWNGAWLQERLAGIVKLGDILFSCPVSEVSAQKIAEALPRREGEGKLTFALTVQGKAPSLKRLPIELKKALQATGRSVRWFADEQGAVSPAAVAKLHLTTEGYDVVIIIDEQLAHVGLTTHVQDADAWSLRDYGRPARDAKNGMLPPKLARVMVNLGMGICKTDSTTKSILDPFCGSGTVLMEAALMDQCATVVGADIDERQITDTLRNLDWMVEKHLLSTERRASIRCFPHDVRTIDQAMREPIDMVITEGFLGTPLQGHETGLHLEREARTIAELWREALRSLGRLQTSDGVIVGIWPMLQTSHGKASVQVEPFLAEAGYELVNPLEDWSNSFEPLIYARPDQKVQRRIVVLRKR